MVDEAVLCTCCNCAKDGGAKITLVSYVRKLEVLRSLLIQCDVSRNEGQLLIPDFLQVMISYAGYDEYNLVVKTGENWTNEHH